MRTLKRTTWLAVGLAMVAAFAGCQLPSEKGSGDAVESEIVASNGLTMVNACR